MTALRSMLYWLARVLGDVQAIRKGQLADRLYNRMMGRAVRRITNPLFRRWR